MNKPTELLPCPFCGSLGIGAHPDVHGIMFCEDCEAQGPRISFGEPRDATERWNTRATHLEEVVRLREALTKCRDTFRDYERQHEEKAKQIFENGKAQGLLNAERMAMQARLTKAARNCEMADMCDAALTLFEVRR
jgi:Lar family restriction alleviation protein